MRPYKPDVSNLKFVPHGNHKTIGIPFDIEYNPVITENTGCPVFCFNVPRTLPLCLLGFSILRSQGVFRIRMSLPEEFQCFYRNNPHEVIYTVPNLGTSPRTRAVREMVSRILLPEFSPLSSVSGWSSLLTKQEAPRNQSTKKQILALNFSSAKVYTPSSFR